MEARYSKHGGLHAHRAYGSLRGVSRGGRAITARMARDRDDQELPWNGCARSASRNGPSGDGPDEDGGRRQQLPPHSKDERVARHDNEWYALVGLRGIDERPDFYLLPRDHVAVHLYVGHRHWLSEPGRGGRPHVDSPMRSIYRADVEPYRERWELLTTLSASARWRSRSTSPASRPMCSRSGSHTWRQTDRI